MGNICPSRSSCCGLLGWMRPGPGPGPYRAAGCVWFWAERPLAAWCLWRSADVNNVFVLFSCFGFWTRASCSPEWNAGVSQRHSAEPQVEKQTWSFISVTFKCLQSRWLNIAAQQNGDTPLSWNWTVEQIKCIISRSAHIIHCYRASEKSVSIIYHLTSSFSPPWH